MSQTACPPPRAEANHILPCPCCGSQGGTTFTRCLWPELVEEWGLSESERTYIDRQQGEACVRCHCNLRSQALALAVLRTVGFGGTFQKFAASFRGRRLRTLEINPAGDLTRFFPGRSRHELRSYPDLDMMDMAGIADRKYDLVIHSDTLEHVPDPVQALRECRRVLRPGGACCFTVPIIVGRLSRSRENLPPSYHGDPMDPRNDFIVYTEYGADAWRQVLEAGFAECRIVPIRAPAAHALIGIR